MKKRILLFHLFICMIAINSNAASKSIEKEYNQNQQEYNSSQLAGPITVSLSATPVYCFGGNDGSASASASGGTAPYTYLWSDPAAQNTPTAVGLRAGLYRVTVTDSNGLSTSATVTISEPPLIAATAKSTNTSCFGANDGSATISASGGTEPYTYLWDDSSAQTTSTAIGLNAGVYQIHVTDANGCSAIVSINISPKAPPATPTLVVSAQPNCFITTETIKVNSPLGVNYLYSLDGGTYTSVSTFAILAPGSTHTITIRDLWTGCTSAATVKIDLLPANPATPSATVTVNPTCENPHGTVVVTSPVGAAFEYTIAGKTQSSVSFTDLVTGTYSITVRNTITGCSSFGSVIVPAIPPSPLLKVISFVNPKCYGDTYTITITMTNTPSGNYNIAYDGGQFANVKILAGTATITGQFTENFKEFNNLTFVANGCTSTGTVNDVRIDNPTQIVISNIKVTEHVLKATTKGAIDITANGGTGQLKYLWSNTATTQDINDVSFGVYTVTVTDVNNCQVAKSIKIPLNNPPVAVADNYFYSCIVLTGDLLVNDYDPDPADQNDFITINTKPVVGPKHAKAFKINTNGTFSYEVVSGYSGPDAFVYEIADKFGQTATATVTINVENTISIVITESITQIDFGIPRMGAIDLQVAGGTESYTYQWNNGAVTKDIHNLQEGGTYTVTVTNSNGCSKIKSFTLAIPNYLPVAKAGADQIVYEGVTVTLDGSGSTDANQDQLSYIWAVPVGVLLSNSTSSKPSFLAPEVKRDTIITITLVVNDGKANSLPASVKVAIQNVIKVGNTQLESSLLNIYPNPTTGILRIEGLSVNKRNKITLFTADGRLIKKKSSNSTNDLIDIGDKPSGLYILHINNQIFKIVKE